MPFFLGAPKPIRATTEVQWPKTWGHRGASAEYPENTMASFVAAIREGANGLESDLHLTRDGRLILFHDARLDRTTNGSGLIGEQDWTGGIEHLRTTAEPVQPIPLFEELIELLTKPENSHVCFNIDIKPSSNPEALFPVMARILSAYPSILPRLVLGLWHPSFILPSYRHLPRSMQRFHIGASIPFARQWWNYVDGFSMIFDCLVDYDGKKFREDCKREGKKLGVWTVNDEREMLAAASWGLDVVLTDLPTRNLSLGSRSKSESDFNRTQREVGFNSWTFPWSQWKYWGMNHRARSVLEIDEIVRDGGPDLTFPPLESDVVCRPLPVSPGPSPALSASGTSSVPSSAVNTPLNPPVDDLANLRANTKGAVSNEVRVVDEIRV